MRYWKGKKGSIKAGQMGTMDDNGFVPDSEPATKGEYDAWCALQPTTSQRDFAAEYAIAVTDSERIAILAARLNLL